MAELEHELESAHHESQDRAVEVTEAWAVEWLAAERASATERGLEAVKVYQAEIEAMLQKSLADTEVALQSSLETLETEQKDLELEQKAWSKADQEVLVLRGRVMGTEEVNAQLCEHVTQLKEGLSILENTHLDT